MTHHYIFKKIKVVSERGLMRVNIPGIETLYSNFQ